MAKEVVQQRGLAIRLACAVFSISESCYRYESKHNAENAEIANWLIRLTDNHRNWGFGLCYLCLRNVKGFRCLFASGQDHLMSALLPRGYRVDRSNPCRHTWANCHSPHSYISGISNA